MAAPVNPPKNVYILDKSAAYGQIRCRLARYRQSDPKVQRLMLKLEQHQPISSSGVASNLSRAPGAYPQSSYGAENSGQRSSYKNLKHWGLLHRRSLSLSSHPWRPGGSPNAAWKALGGVNEISSLDREQLQERESCEEVRCKEEELWILAQEEDRRARCIACGVMSNLQLLEGIHADSKQRQSESGKAHVCQRSIAPVKPGNLSPPWPPLSLLKSGDTSRIAGRAPWRRVGAGETHQTFSDRNGCAFCGPKAQANLQALPHPGTHQEPGNGNVRSQHSPVYPATNMLVIQDQGEKMMQQDLVGEKVQLMPATVLSEMGSLATDQYKIGKDIDNLAQGHSVITLPQCSIFVVYSVL
ncbi:unnamed protein product [Sphagnum jensenii]|uniref:Uncharacterized protein n=1 Tax=Sphagnum jensenii TaxID=128206 RepID=A0ABP1B3D2_9BRYO